jgi:hypothetical protein
VEAGLAEEHGGAVDVHQLEEHMREVKRTQHHAKEDGRIRHIETGSVLAHGSLLLRIWRRLPRMSSIVFPEIAPQHLGTTDVAHPEIAVSVPRYTNGPLISRKIAGESSVPAQALKLKRR